MSSPRHGDLQHSWLDLLQHAIFVLATVKSIGEKQASLQRFWLRHGLARHLPQRSIKKDLMNSQAIEEKVSNATHQLANEQQALATCTKRAARVTDEYLHGHPWTAIGMAAAFGLLVGVLLGQRRD